MSSQISSIHRVDATGRLCYVDKGFRQAAHEGGVPDLPDRALGTQLWDHIYGETTKEWYRRIFDHVLREGSLSFIFQCDTPTLERRLSMAITCLPNGSTQFTCVTLSVTPRPLVKVLDWSIPHSSRNQIVMCSVCLRVYWMTRWIPISQATHVLQIFQEEEPPSIEYTVCEDDEDYLEAMLQRRIDE